MKLVLLINLKLLTIAISFLLNIAGRENFSANKYFLAEKISCSAELSMKWGVCVCEGVGGWGGERGAGLLCFAASN